MKARVVVHHVSQKKDDTNNLTARYQETLIYDGRGENMKMSAIEQPGFVDHDNKDTINIVHELNHFTVLNRLYKK